MKKILVIDDDSAVMALTTKTLESRGFRTLTAENGVVGLEMAKKHLPDLIICDIQMPQLNGYETLAALRQDPTTAAIPFVFLTGLAERKQFRQGMGLGADDYLTKPFSFEELLARVKAILRRQQRLSGPSVPAAPGKRVLRVADLELNEATREIRRAGRPIDPLTATEYNLLHLFMTHPRQVLDRQTVLARVLGYDFMGETNIIEVYVRYLREKIEDEPSQPKYIQTVRGVGYVLKE